MINLKRSKNLAQSSKAKIRLNRLNKGINQRKPKLKESKRKRRKGDTQNNTKNVTKRKTIALLQLELMLLQPQPQVKVAKRRKKPKMLPRSSILVATKRDTMLPTISSQKTSCSLGNLYVNDCQLGRLIAHTLHLEYYLILRKLVNQSLD